MKKKATTRLAKATSRQSTLNFPTSSDADLVAESTAAETSTKSGATNRRKRTEVKNSTTDITPQPSASMQGHAATHVKNRSAAFGRDPSNAQRSEEVVQQSATTLLDDLLAKRAAGFRGRGNYHQPTAPDLTGLPDPPNGWIWESPEQLSNAAPYSLGIGPFGSNLKVSDYQESGVPLIFVRNIRAEDFSLVAKFVTEEKAKELAAHTAEGGDILITKMGEPPGDTAYYPLGAPRAVITADCIKWRLADDLCVPKFFVYAIRSRSVQEQIQNRTRGVAQKKISLERFRDLAIPLAPLPEQHRIVAEIEKQFTRLDTGVAALKRVQANLKRYRAAVLKAACEGKLVPTEAKLARQEGRNYETGEQLLQRILTERRDTWHGRKQYKESTNPDAANLPPLPAGWTWGTFDQITTLITKGSSPNWQGFDYCDHGIMFVRSENVRWGTLNLQGVAYLPPEFNEKETKSVLREGDVLLNLVGASIGRAAIATDEVEGGNVNQAVAVIRLVSKKTMNQFAMLWLNSSNAQKRIHENKVDVARANFGLDDTRVLPIPLPPLAEQIRIVAEVERRLSVVEELEAVVSANLKRATRLRQSILASAFNGCLANIR